MSITVDIRCAQPSERSALGLLHQRASYVWEADRADLEAHPDALGVAAEKIIKGQVRVAVGADGSLLGFSVVAYAADGVCELDDLFVDPDFMRMGIGRALVEDAATRAASGKYRLMTAISHERNFAFYESVGFLGREPTSTRFGPATLLRRPLSPSD